MEDADAISRQLFDAGCDAREPGRTLAPVSGLLLF